MNPSDYEYLANFLRGASGLSIGTGKEYLLEARLIPLAQSFGLSGIEELVCELRKNPEERLTSAVTEAMTTNETSFFRDKVPFEELAEQLLPDIISARESSKRLRIWCAAASTGQEIYSIKMLLEERFPQLKDWTIEIVATDIDKSALARCEQGAYSQFEVQRGLAIQKLMQNFDQTETGWRIKEHLRKNIRWQQLNLLNEFSSLGTFDLIFCRNVLIYFEIETKTHILDRMSKMLRSDGYLFLGAAETVLGISEMFQRYKPCKSAVYFPMAKVTA